MDIVEKNFKLKDLLHTHLVLGQTRWVCRYGTLGEGHENITNAHKYFQAIREAYSLACAVKRSKAMNLKCRASVLEHKNHVDNCSELTPESTRLTAQADLELAELALIENEVTMADQMRQLSEYDAIIGELHDEIEAKYPQGIEQASADMWKDRMRYRLEHRESIKNIPMPENAKQFLLDDFVNKHSKRLGVANV
jgi:hypothetical protein